MTNTERQCQRARASNDQLWAGLRPKVDDIVRIALEGPNDSNRDALFVREVFALVGSMLTLPDQEPKR